MKLMLTTIALQLYCIAAHAQAAKPVLFLPGIVSSGHYERDISFSPDGNSLYYTIQQPKTGYAHIVFCTRQGRVWGQPQMVSFSGTYSDMEPFFAPDGSKLFFASDRPTDAADTIPDYNIWYAEYSNNLFGPPVCLNSKINSPQNEFYPAVAANGNLYFTAVRAGGVGTEDIWFCPLINGEYGTPQVLDSMVNSKGYEFNAWVSPDDNMLVFTAYGRADDMGRGDLYISTRNAKGNWDKAKNMGPGVNSPYLDYCPFISYDKTTLYFTSERLDEGIKAPDKKIDVFRRWLNSPGNGNGDIYSVPFTPVK